MVEGLFRDLEAIFENHLSGGESSYRGNSGTSDGVARCSRVKGRLSIGRKMSDTMRANCSRTKRSLFGLV